LGTLCIVEEYIYFCMIDLEYDGIYRFFQLSEIKLTQKLSKFNLVWKIIVFSMIFLLTYFFIPIQYHIDSYYSNQNNFSSPLCSSRFIHNPTVTPKVSRNAIPDISLKKQKSTKKKKRHLIFLELKFNIYVFLLVNFSQSNFYCYS